MSQVTIYLDAETERKMRAYVKAKSISQSQWIAGLVRERLQSEWPAHIAALSGAWADFPSLEEIRGKTNADADRESL